jgi:hypothetical protein
LGFPGQVWDFIPNRKAERAAGRRPYWLFFSDSLAPVKSGDKYGFIDLMGQWAIPPKYDSEGHFREGLCSLKIDHKEGLSTEMGE